MSIQILSETLVAQIAAGEVVERPASVVKELLENALDAGATTITVDIRGAGIQLIRISDNGHGIPQQEVELALARHATSKLREIDDLYRLHSLGFRGEALHSIASVSRLTLTARHRDEEMGARVMVEGGKLLETRGIGAPSGTVVEVADLFYNVPARRKFLKSDATERRHVVTVVTQYAMAYPDVRFKLIIDGRENFHSTGSGDLADVIISVMGIDVFREMVEISPLPPSRPDLPAIEVYGFTTAPNLNRANRSQITLFVNGRVINDQRITYAVVQAYHTLLPSGRYPISTVMISVDPEDVDVNVHPTKAEVRFRAPDAIFSAVQRAVRSAVVNQTDTRNFNQMSDYDDDFDSSNTDSTSPKDADWARRHSTMMSVGQRERSSSDSNQLNLDLDLASPGRYTKQIPPDEASENGEEAFYPHYETALPPHLRNDTRNRVSEEDPTALPDGLGAPQRPRTLPILRVVGQITASYIVAEGPSGMYLIDQHAAHERILYEQFMAAYQNQQLAIQGVLDTVTVELGALQARVLEEYQDQLAEIGFEIEEFGKNIYRIRAVPAMLSDRDPAEVLYQLLDDAEQGNEPGRKSIEDKIVRRICKAAAVKAGQVLSHAEMQGMIRQLERCENPHTCPHGRPTLLHLSRNQLEKEFGRT